MKKHILITGGAGYIGSSLVRLLLNHYYNVTVIDNLTFGRGPIKGYLRHSNFKFIKSDITSTKAIEGIFNNAHIEAVIHLAAIVGDQACAKQPKRAVRVNLDASINLLELSIKHRVKRFIFSSTCSNYGKMAESSSYVTETSSLAPLSLYAKLKVKFEDFILKKFKRKNDFSPVVLRFATAYGISPRMRFDLTVNEFTKELVLGRELTVFGQHFWRPYCHVCDLAGAVLLVLESDMHKISYNVFNVGDTNENYQKRMIVEEIKKTIPFAKVRYVEKDEDSRDYRVSFEKIKRELGFSITKIVPDGINEIRDSFEKKFFLNPDDAKYRNS